MLKKEERQLIRTALMEYRNNMFKSFHGLDEEKKTIMSVNHILQNWKI